MPTKKKRVGFIPREDVLKIIDKLSIENNLSNSKIISILIEEALSIRGLFNQKNVEMIKGNTNNLKNFSKASVGFNDIEKSTINTKAVNHVYPGKTSLLKQRNQQDFDLQTYNKFLTFLKFQEMMEKYDN